MSTTLKFYNFTASGTPLPELIAEYEKCFADVALVEKETAAMRDHYLIQSAYLDIVKKYRTLFRDVMFGILKAESSVHRADARTKAMKKLNVLEKEMLRLSNMMVGHIAKQSGQVQETVEAVPVVKAPDEVLEKDRSSITEQINKVGDLIREYTNMNVTLGNPGV